MRYDLNKYFKLMAIVLSMAIFNLGYTGAYLAGWLNKCLVEKSTPVSSDFSNFPQTEEEDDPVNEKEVKLCYSNDLNWMAQQQLTEFMIRENVDLPATEIVVFTPPPEHSYLPSC